MITSLREAAAAEATVATAAPEEGGDNGSMGVDLMARMKRVIHGGWMPDWSDCALCKRACHRTSSSKCSIERVSVDDLTRERFVKEVSAYYSDLSIARHVYHSK